MATEGSNLTFDVVSQFHRLAEHDKALLARNLHDQVGGLLIGALMDIATLAPRAAELGAGSLETVSRVRQALQSAIQITRHMTEQLRPTLLDNVGLFSALRWQLRNVCTTAKITYADDLPHAEPRLTPVASIALFRSVQEALIVGTERPGVTELTMAATLNDEVLCIQVMGDGACLPSEPRELVNVSLESVRFRLRSVGGAVDVEHPPAGGIVLALRAPIANVMEHNETGSE